MAPNPSRVCVVLSQGAHEEWIEVGDPETLNAEQNVAEAEVVAAEPRSPDSSGAQENTTEDPSLATPRWVSR